MVIGVPATSITLDQASATMTFLGGSLNAVYGTGGLIQVNSGTLALNAPTVQMEGGIFNIDTS